jgi:nucleotide-binding universal stress UspA family protein
MFNKILVPVDLSTEDTTKKLCVAANDMAEKYGSEVRLMTVVPDYGMPLVASYFPEGAQEKLKEEMKKKLEELANTYFSASAKIHLTQGKRRQAILKEIEEYKPDLVMLGCRRKKSRLGQRLLGATGTAVTDRANCSVMVVR